MSDKLLQLSQKLNAKSREEYKNPYTLFNWPETFSENTWFFSPELISLYGTEAYLSLGEEQQQKLSFYELINFFSLTMHGEQFLIPGLSIRLHKDLQADINAYLQHFLDEENKHMVWFNTFCTKYAGKIYPDKKLHFPRDYEEGEEDFLYFIKVMLFEEINGAHNGHLAKDDRLPSIVRDINRQHLIEESRHLAFGHQMVADIFNEYSKRWSEKTLENVRSYLTSYIKTVWQEYYNPDVYKDVGIDNPQSWAKAAWESEFKAEQRRNMSKNFTRFLLDNNILLEPPL